MAEHFPYALCVEGEWDPNTPKLKNKLIIYFQSKNKSDGGDCQVEYDVSDGQKATVRFKTEEVRQRVLQKKTHELKLGQKTLKITVSLPSSEVSKHEEPPVSSVSLSDAQILQSEDCDMTKCKRKPDACSMPQQAVLELKKPRLVDEDMLELEEEPAAEENDTSCRSVVIENIQNQSKEFLGMLVENLLRGTSAESKDFSLEIIPESSCAVVTFTENSDKDIKNFILSCLSNAMIKKKNMHVRLLEMTSKVRAEGLPPNTNTDYLMLYFEKFGEVEDDVEIFEEEQSAIITFKNPKDAHEVIKVQHQIKKHPIRVLPYYDTLQTALYGKDRPTLRLPDAFTKNIDETVWRHIKGNQSCLNLITQDMSSCFCEIDFQSPAIGINPLSSILQQGGQAKLLLQTWKEKTSSEFTKSMSRFRSIELHIQRDAWDEVEPQIHKAIALDDVTLVSNVDQGTISVAGLEKDVNNIEHSLKEIVESITQRIQREKGSEMDEINIPPSIYKLIVCGGVEQQIRDKFPKLELTYHAVGQKLTLYGLKQEVLESKNKLLEDRLNLIRKTVELHESVLEFLHNKDIEEMTETLFLSKGIHVSLQVEENRAFLFGKTEKAVTEGEKQLSNELGHCSIDVEDPSVLRKTDWHDLVSNIKNTVTSVTIQMTLNQVVVSGFVKSIKTVEKQLSDFVHENSQMQKTLKAHKTVIRFIKDHKTQDWIKEVQGKVTVDFQNETILLSGPRLHVSQCVPVFENLLSSVHHCTMKIAKPGSKKFFKDKESMCVAVAKNDTGCLVQLVDEFDPAHSPPKSGIKPVYQFTTPDGLEITVNKGNMCAFEVDAVVSGTNENLHLDGGLAKALLDAAGPKLQDDCYQLIKRRKLTTGDAVVLDAGGKLRCKYVILAVVPHYNSAKSQDVVMLLKKTVRRSLNLADQENCQSVAIPAISSGAYGFPLDLCADTIVKAMKEFCDIVGTDSVLRKIHLVDSNDKTVQALEAAVQKIYGVSAGSHSIATGGGSGNQQQNQAGSSQSQAAPTHPSQIFQTKEGLTITLLKGNIERTTMDVVVNTLSSDLNLSVGAVSNALLNAAGPQLQVLLNQKATGPANAGAVFVTAGANLKNKMVFHAVVPHWNQGQGTEQKVLEGVMDECLGQAEQHQQKSIVFSAIGTGNLGFPKTLVACSMLDCALKFSSKRSSKHVQEVVFVLHPKDTQTIQAFTDEFNKRFMVQSTLADILTPQQSTGPFSKITTQSGVHETTVGGITLQVLQGDITAEQTDVIVNSSNKDFTLKSGVSKAILDKAGPNVEAECQKLGAQPNKGLIMTQAGNLQCKKIIHIAAQSNAITLQKQVKTALQMCAKEKFTSIAFPAIGTGQAGLHPGQVADSMIDAVLDIVGLTPQSSIKLIRMVVFQAPMLNDFHRSMQNRESTGKQEKQTTWSKIKTYAWNVKTFITGSVEKDLKQDGGKDFVIKGIEVDPACFSICGPSQTAVDKTKTLLEEMITSDQALESITDPVILRLSDKDRQRIQDLQSTNCVTVTLKYKAQKSPEGPGEVTLVVEGLTRDVLTVIREIQDMLKKAKEEEILKKGMEYTSDLVDWQYEQGGRYQSFDAKTNYELEQALSGQATDVSISFQGQVYQIKLPEGPALSTTGGNQMNIKRIDKLKATESIPQEWDAMGPGELTKRCCLQPSSNEYNDVLKLFQATCPNNKVLKIERIQNPGMWRNYQNNKKVMELKNGHQNNEKRLFHGTSEQTINHVNKSGFNRSYAGKNAAAYGNGTYFALNARYSSSNTYSVPNAQGQKHMYLCRVLAGDYTTGRSGMIVPPAKNNTGFDLYDTVVDNPAAPTIFVVFRDDNAYPEYLITFT